MSMSRKQIGSRLRKAREELGFTQRDVAEAMEMHRPTITEIEAGRRAVSTEELYRFSSLFVLPIHALLGEAAPKSSDVERILFRAETVETPMVRTAVRRFMDRCRAECELERLLGIDPLPDARPAYRADPPRGKWQAIRQGEEIAKAERRRLELGSEPLRNPLALLERQGVRIGPIEGLNEHGPDGLYFETDDLGACVAVNPERDQWTGFRSAFTAAHEYAHWLLRDVQAEEFEFQNQSGGHREVRANVFAAAFLMPEDGLRDYFAQQGLPKDGVIQHLSPADIVRAMDHFGVSSQALLYRLQNVGCLTKETAESLRQADFSPVGIARSLGITFRARRRFGERLPTLAVLAWRRGLIGTGRAADLCGLDIVEFRAAMTELGEGPEAEADELLGAAAGG